MRLCFGNEENRRPLLSTKPGKSRSSSICTGEQTAGFRDQASGQFQEVMLLRSDGDLEEFQRLYGVEASDIKREW